MKKSKKFNYKIPELSSLYIQERIYYNYTELGELFIILMSSRMHLISGYVFIAEQWYIYTKGERYGYISIDYEGIVPSTKYLGGIKRAK